MRSTPRFTEARPAHRYRRYRDANPRAKGKPHRGASDRDLAPRMSRPPHRAGRATSAVGADRVHAVLQPGTAASDARIADPLAESAAKHKCCLIAATVERT